MAVTSIEVNIADASYSVFIGDGILEKAGEYLRRANRSKRLALVTDTKVGPKYGIRASASFAKQSYDVIELTIPTGEETKNLTCIEQLCEAYVERGLGRKDIIVALGGGVVGDITGFSAATYLRGVQFAQVPTTLLAMVDSSIGGKTGVNLTAGKNLVGAFKQPKAVVMDVRLLQSLPAREWKSGFAEVIKTAMISSESFWKWLLSHAESLIEHDFETIIEAVYKCVEFKSSVVARDEKENGPRETLNYGHTLGHAIEKLAGYGSIGHGQAVAEGMRFASRLAVEAIGAPIELVKEQDTVLDAFGLPSLKWSARPHDLLAAMKSDKKARSGKVRFVLAKAPGVCGTVAIDDELLLTHLDAWYRSKSAMGIKPIEVAKEQDEPEIEPSEPNDLAETAKPETEIETQ